MQTPRYYGESCCWLILVIIWKIRVSSTFWVSYWIRMTELGQTHPVLYVFSDDNSRSKKRQGKVPAPESQAVPWRWKGISHVSGSSSLFTLPRLAPGGVCHSLQSAALTALCALPRLGLQCWCLHLGTRSNPHPRKSNIIAFLFLKLELWLFLEMLKACIKPVVEISFTKDELTTLPCSVDTEKKIKSLLRISSR